MEMNELRRAIIRSAVQKSIREIRQDPKRGIRKMVDLALHFSHGRFQRKILEVMQKELSNPSSAYYSIVTDLAANVKPENLEQFGMDLGYNSWTHGAQIIRNHEAEHGYNVPWCLVLDLRQGMGFDVGEVMTQGEKMGIYAYFVFAGNEEQTETLCSVFHTHPDCAVFLLLPDAELPRVNIENAPNVMTFLPVQDGGTTESAKELLQKQALFGLWMRYDGGNAQRVLAGEIENLAGGMGAPLVLAVPDEACEQGVRAQVSDCYRARREQKNTPALLADFYTAIAEIDCVISVESCLLGICSDGTIFTEKGRNPHFSVSNISLEDILMCTMPRVTYDAAQQPEGENK